MRYPKAKDDEWIRPLMIKPFQYFCRNYIEVKAEDWLYNVGEINEQIMAEELGLTDFNIEELK